MPILLKSAFSVGDLAPKGSEGFKYAQITTLLHNGLTMGVMVEMQIGTASGSYYEVWQRGDNTPTKVIDVPPSKVIELWSEKPNDGESIGEAMRRTTYQYILDEGYFEGEIVNNPPLPPVEAKPETPAETAPAAETPAEEAPAPAESTEPEQPAEPAAETPAETPASEDSGASESDDNKQPSEPTSTEETPAEDAPAEPTPSAS